MFISDVVLITIGCLFVGAMIAIVTIDIAAAIQEHKRAKQAREDAEKTQLDTIAAQLDVLTRFLLNEHKKDRRD